MHFSTSLVRRYPSHLLRFGGHHRVLHDVWPHPPAVDPESFVHSRYIILWAINTISSNLHHWPFIAEAQRRGAKVVVIDPVATRTAKQADWHLAIKPGTDAALALGMINVIIAEDLVDH